MPNGQNIMEYFHERLYELVYSPTTEYYHVIVKNRMVDAPVILTHQVEEWIPYTQKWLHVYIPHAKVIYVKDPEEKINYINQFKDMYIVEDYPRFKDNSKVIMIDRPYNRKVRNCFCRVTKPEELQYLMEA